MPFCHYRYYLQMQGREGGPAIDAAEAPGVGARRRPALLLRGWGALKVHRAAAAGMVLKEKDHGGGGGGCRPTIAASSMSRCVV